jgi:class 3 adenylate cyclase/CHASE2 domain-containing sensor protein
MTERRLRHLLVALVSVLVGLASAQGAFHRFDRQIVDGFFWAREAVGANPPVDDRILLVNLDAAVTEEIGQPVSRWCDDYALAVRNLLEGGAAAVALDIVYAPALTKMPPEEADPIWAEIAQLAELTLTQPVVIVDAYRPGGQDLTSVKELHFAADDQGNVAYNNMLTDPDGKVRCLGLVFRDKPPYLNRNLAGRLAELGAGRKITSGGEPVEGLEAEPDHKMRINYPGPPDVTFPSISMASLLLGEKPDVTGKICIIGPVEDANDLHVTPFGATLGMEIHAAALNTILTEHYLLRAPLWLHLALCISCAVLAYSVSRRAPVGALLIGFPFCAALYLGLAFASFAWVGQLLPLTGPIGLATLVGAQTYIQRYVALERSRRYVRGLLGRFVSPQVMEELLAKPENVQLGGRRRRITILFSDINNFTPVCESRAPEEVIGMLNDFFEEMLEIIFRHGGTVKQFVGDEIMVLYGAPEAVDDHAARAVRTARDMMDRLKALQAQKGEGTGFYDVKIGIHTGYAVVGNVGNEKRSEYAAVGDSVNTTARIEALTKEVGEAILISEETRAEAAPVLTDIEFVSKGVKKFKGKIDQLEVFGIRWKSPESSS